MGCDILLPTIISWAGGAFWSKSNFGPIATMFFEVVHLSVYAPFTALLSCLNASWNSCCLRVFSSACNPAWITSIVSKWLYLQSGKARSWRAQVRWVGWMGQGISVASDQKFSREKKCETVCCRYATASTFFTKIIFTFSHSCHKTLQ